MEQTGFDPKRRLCPDGSCVGLINPDGRCSVCGRTAAAAAAGQEADVDHAADAGADDSFEAEVPGATALGGLELSPGFDPKRRLCEDGSCVGVIGADGACTVCGMKTAG
jgi:hypothetical protein